MMASAPQRATCKARSELSLPTYAEEVAPKIIEKNEIQLLEALKSRVGDVHKESKRKRIENVFAGLSKSSA